MIYITGDTHGSFERIKKFCNRFKTTKEDILIILGDAGINFFGPKSKRDKLGKIYLSTLPITLFCIHGNHEMRPSKISSYKLVDYLGGKVWVEEAYSNILFAKDGEIFNFNIDGIEYKTIVIGGAYSVDKYYRLNKGFPWFDDEQPSDEIKRFVESQLGKLDNTVDIVLSHTCPLKFEPVEWFLSMIDQSSVDKSTERWLDEIEEKIKYNKWYCGHYHGSKEIDRLVFMFENFELLKV